MIDHSNQKYNLVSTLIYYKIYEAYQHIHFVQVLSNLLCLLHLHSYNFQYHPDQYHFLPNRKLHYYISLDQLLYSFDYCSRFFSIIIL
nr:MAG TPA: hypothetical protein [Caudoviricetes sp.]